MEKVRNNLTNVLIYNKLLNYVFMVKFYSGTDSRSK